MHWLWLLPASRAQRACMFVYFILGTERRNVTAASVEGALHFYMREMEEFHLTASLHCKAKQESIAFCLLSHTANLLRGISIFPSPLAVNKFSHRMWFFTQTARDSSLLARRRGLMSAFLLRDNFYSLWSEKSLHFLFLSNFKSMFGWLSAMCNYMLLSLVGPIQLQA